MADAGFITLWEFTVRPARQSEFESGYGPEGDWVRLFHHGAGYLGTELLQDRANSLRYLTIDRWESLEAWRAFRARFAGEYERLDREFEGLADRETALGEYAPAGSVRHAL